MRDSLTILLNKVAGKVHFCETSLRGNDTWYDFKGDHDDLFVFVEDKMVTSGIAHNITSVQYARTCGQNTEYTVVYNHALSKAV